MKEINLDIFFDYISFACYYYTPTKYNQKKIKSLFESLPYFLPIYQQNILYKLFLKYPIETFIDNSERMKEYGYLIYMEYNKGELNDYVDYPTYLSRFETKLYKEDKMFIKNRVHNILFFLLLLLIIFLIYK